MKRILLTVTVLLILASPLFAGRVSAITGSPDRFVGRNAMLWGEIERAITFSVNDALLTAAILTDGENRLLFVSTKEYERGDTFFGRPRIIGFNDDTAQEGTDGLAEQLVDAELMSARQARQFTRRVSGFLRTARLAERLPVIAFHDP